MSGVSRVVCHEWCVVSGVLLFHIYMEPSELDILTEYRVS